MSNQYLPVELSLSADAFKQDKRQGSDGIIAAPSSFDPNADDATRNRIFERDGYACQYCGFESQKFHLIHDRSFLESSSSGLTSGSSENQKNSSIKSGNDDNLVTSCIFCHQCFHIDKISAMKSGTLIWMPEMTQAQIHHLARSIYVARITQGPMAEIARNTLEMIMKRREEAIERIKTDDPNILATVLKDYITKDNYERRHKKLSGIRLFPLDRRTVSEGTLDFNQFPQILAYWRSKDGPFAALNPNDWIGHYAQLKAA